MFFFFPLFGAMCVDAFGILADFDEASDHGVLTDVGCLVDVDGRLSTGTPVEGSR